MTLLRTVLGKSLQHLGLAVAALYGWTTVFRDPVAAAIAVLATFVAVEVIQFFVLDRRRLKLADRWGDLLEWAGPSFVVFTGLAPLGLALFSVGVLVHAIEAAMGEA